MKTIALSAERGTLQFTRKNIGIPIPRRTTDVAVDSEDTNGDEEVAKGIAEEEIEIEGPDENERIRDGFEWQDDR